MALDRYYQDYASDADFIAEGLAMTVVEDALHIMEAQNLPRAQLAGLMGVSRAHVSTEKPEGTTPSVSQGINASSGINRVW